MKSFVHADLPRGGLGNKLLVWARALVFAHIHELPFVVSNWSEIKIGPYLRREQRKRQYWGYFSQANRLGLIQRLSFLFSEKVHEPALQGQDGASGSTIYVFNRMPDWPDYFKDIRAHRDLVRRSFETIVSPKYLVLAASQEPPAIGVHIRRSDFQEEAAGTPVGEACNVRTPIDYYVNVIRTIRQLCGTSLPATIFTDGREEEIGAVLALPNTRMAERNADIVDMILLSRAKCLVVSAASTFSYWAAFVSDSPVIMHPRHRMPLRPEILARDIFEGSLEDENADELLARNMLGSLTHRAPRHGLQSSEPGA